MPKKSVIDIAKKFNREARHPAKFVRPMTKFAKKHFDGKPIVGVEIGVKHGLNAESMLSYLNFEQLYLIDPFTGYVENEKTFLSGDIRRVRKRLKKFSKKICIVTEKSEDALNLIPDDVDFIYIDGNHQYKYVFSDLKNYYPKLRKGGIIGGHDFYGNFLDVVEAVLDFRDQYMLKLYTGGIDYWIIK